MLCFCRRLEVIPWYTLSAPSPLLRHWKHMIQSIAWPRTWANVWHMYYIHTVNNIYRRYSNTGIQQVLDFRHLDKCNHYNTRTRLGWNEPENTKPRTSQTLRIPNLELSEPRFILWNQTSNLPKKTKLRTEPKVLIA